MWKSTNFIKTREQRKNGGKLTTEALTHEGHTPSTAIKTKEKKKGKKNEWLWSICLSNLWQQRF